MAYLGSSNFGIPIVNLSSDIYVSYDNSQTEARVINLWDMEPSPTKIKMRHVGVGFVFGDFMTNHSILVINRMEYSTT